MTIVTFLGMIGGDGEEKAEYRFESRLKYRLLPDDSTELYRYENMYPLLLRHFPDAEIVAIGTHASIRHQEALIESRHPDLAERVSTTVALPDERDYREIFRRMGEVLDRYDEVVVDISHSFRHLPILMVVDMLIENIKDPGKIRHILFAKEIERSRRYEIVDLREYLTLANISYALASFTKNYTVTTAVQTVDEEYQRLIDLLKVFSDHILANSFDYLLERDTEGNPALTEKLIDILERIKRLPITGPVQRYLDEIQNHMKEILSKGREPLDERYYYFATLMFDKGYLLNAVVLLDEAIAAYALEALRRLDPRLRIAIERFEERIVTRDAKQYNRYELNNSAKSLIKHLQKYNGDLFGEPAAKSIALEATGKIAWKVKRVRSLIFDCDKLRNDLAHGNNDRRLERVRDDIAHLLRRYEEVCRFEDVLSRFST